MSRRRVLSIIAPPQTTTPIATPLLSKPTTRLKAAFAITLICAALLSLPAQEAVASNASAGHEQQAIASGASAGNEHQAFAGQSKASTEHDQPQPISVGNSQTQVIVDEAANTVRIMIGGKEVMTVDASGLHVNGDISFTGKTGVSGGKP